MFLLLGLGRTIHLMLINGCMSVQRGVYFSIWLLPMEIVRYVARENVYSLCSLDENFIVTNDSRTLRYNVYYMHMHDHLNLHAVLTKSMNF